jgi:hypothetical protein
MILNALVERLKRRSKHDFKGRHFEATLILQAVSWYLRYPLSYRDIEKLFLERGLEWTTRPPIVGCWDTATLPGPGHRSHQPEPSRSAVCERATAGAQSARHRPGPSD